MSAGALLTPEEAAERIRVSTKTLRQLRQQGLIRYVAVTERKKLYRPEDCDAYLEARSRFDQPTELRRPTPRRRTGRGNAANVVSFTARRLQRLGERQ